MRHHKKLNSIRIPDYENIFTYKVGPYTWTGKFNAIDGYIHNILSVERRGLLSIFPDRHNHSFTVFGSLRFNNLEMVYNNYRANLAFLEPQGRIYVRTGDNMMSFRFTSPNFLRGIPDFKDIQYKFNINRLEYVNLYLNLILDYKFINYFIGDFNLS